MCLPRLLLPLSALLASCVSTQALRAEAEAVFREHNRVASQVMLLVPELDPDAPHTADLIEADENMLAACQPLNSLAAAQRDQRQVGIRARMAAAQAIDNCRESTRRTAALIREQ